jgi:thiamine biosynthesis lipoprotein
MIALFVSLFLVSCLGKGAPQVHKSSRLLMGTFVEVSVVGNDQEAKKAASEIFDELKRIEMLTSFHRDSELAKINANAGKGPVKTDPELLKIINEALRVARETHGAFDPTVGPLAKLWGFSGEQESRLPSDSEIQETLHLVGWDKVKIDHEAGTVELPQAGMALDLGGIGKGYALNRTAELLAKAGIRSALVNIGGDILALGEKSPGKPWAIGVEDPRNSRAIVAVVSLKDRIIITSGDYERFFEKDGKRYHHILNPRTGYPADKLRSATVVGPVGSTLQPCGTAAFVLGVDQGRKYIESLKDAYGLLIDSEGNNHFTAGAESIFQLK